MSNLPPCPLPKPEPRPVFRPRQRKGPKIKIRSKESCSCGDSKALEKTKDSKIAINFPFFCRGCDLYVARDGKGCAGCGNRMYEARLINKAEPIMVCDECGQHRALKEEGGLDEDEDDNGESGDIWVGGGGIMR